MTTSSSSMENGGGSSSSGSSSLHGCMQEFKLFQTHSGLSLWYELSYKLFEDFSGIQMILSFEYHIVLFDVIDVS
ncbi:hypothetical protein F2Q70_00007707 [Brassica cretica]|uniref:Uncharacterized protein n=1 Tax=Brassica cretica TaxID=69181 RepID=A0A8S9LPZ9_BRACR|nr:hypothetical protein F2Q70_00007707 [Brassica cretica]